MSAANTLPGPRDLERELAVAQQEGLAANLRRALAFVGNRGPVEFQALEVREGRWSHNGAAHALDADQAVALCTSADAALSDGVYLIPSELHAGVETRYVVPPVWYEMKKGGSTTDNDIARRCAFSIDCDVKRPTKISATDAQMAASVRVALAVYEYIVPIVGDGSIAYVHSGNGRQLWVALDHIEANADTKRAIAVVLESLAQRFTSDVVKIDLTLSDHKRLLPACGTVKKKGAAGIADRPHRRTAIVVPPGVRRLPLAALVAFGEQLRADLDEAGRAAVDKATGVKTTGAKTASRASGPVPRQGPDPFRIANGLDPQPIAEWLGLYRDGVLHCPGCDETAGVDVIDRGLKCLHDRCHTKGRNGFRTNIDLVVEVRGVTVREAYELLAKQFGLEPLPPKVSQAEHEAAHKAHRTWFGSESEPPPGRFDDEAPEEEAPPRAPVTPAEVLDRLAAQGPAVHVSTGLAPLDEHTAGGPRLGDLVLVLGAPDQAKTMLCVALADSWAERACVGVFAVDEDDEGIVTRLAQRRGWRRPDVERRERFDDLRERMPSLHIYDGSWSLSAAIPDLAARAEGRPVILICDSLQTIAEGSSTASDENQAAAVSRTLGALRAAARDRRWLVVVTSEMTRSAYSGETRTNSLAAGKWSGSIEYAAKLLLALKPIEGEPDQVHVEIAKNKLGPHGEMRLRIDRARQTVTAENAPAGGQAALDSATVQAKHALRITSWLAARGGRFVGTKTALWQAIGMQKTAFFAAFSTLDGVRVRVTPASDSTAAEIVLLPTKSDDRTDGTDSTATVPGTAVPVPSPLKGAVLGTPRAERDARRDAEQQARRTQADADAKTLQEIPPKQRRAWMLAEGWPTGRMDRARALLGLQPAAEVPEAKATKPEKPKKTKKKAPAGGAA